MSDYLLFLARTVTVVVAIVVVAAALAAVLAVAASRVGRRRASGERAESPVVRVTRLGERYGELAAAVEDGLLPPRQARRRARRRAKERAKESTQHRDDAPAGQRQRVFVLDFDGDMQASGVRSLRQEVTALTAVLRDGDEVVVRLTNPGGTVPAQGLAASQLLRLRRPGVRLTVAVDTVAASGGYMMACVADRIVAAPFAVVGSIGVVTQIPNVHRLLDRAGIDYEQVTGGRWKRTVTPFTATTEESRRKLTEQVEDTHALFKEFVVANRPALDVEAVATGEYWYGARALELGLVDEVVTSDEYLVGRAKEADVLALSVRAAPSGPPWRRFLPGAASRHHQDPAI